MINPKKSLGQNFLLDKNICNKIINLIEIKNKNIIEIGPGTGNLTDKIIKLNPKRLIIIEKDNLLSKELKKKYQNYSNIVIINKDCLKIDFTKYNNFCFISNLPYNLSTKIILKLIKDLNNENKMIFMIQKEVAKKFNYNFNKKLNKYNFIISTLTKFKEEFNISNKVFYPKPKIQSTIISIQLNINIDLKDKLLDFSNFIFKNKRKKLKNNIKNTFNDTKCIKILDQRVENLKPSELLYLFNKF